MTGAGPAVLSTMAVEKDLVAGRLIRVPVRGIDPAGGCVRSGRTANGPPGRRANC